MGYRKEYSRRACRWFRARNGGFDGESTEIPRGVLGDYSKERLAEEQDGAAPQDQEEAIEFCYLICATLCAARFQFVVISVSAVTMVYYNS